jgi:hypothetical protein
VVSGLAQEAYVKTVIASFGSGARSGHSITLSAVASSAGDYGRLIRQHIEESQSKS